MKNSFCVTLVLTIGLQHISGESQKQISEFFNLNYDGKMNRVRALKLVTGLAVEYAFILLLFPNPPQLHWTTRQH